MDVPIITNDLTLRSPQSKRNLNKDSSSPKLYKAASGTFGQEVKSPKASAQNIAFPTTVPTSLPENEKFKVLVRVRPLDNKELGTNNPKKRQSVVKAEENMIFVFNPNIGPEFAYKQDKAYVFDKVFDQEVSTHEVYQKGLTEAVQNVINGYNSSILAYGMTGAGKTFTMFGDIYNSSGGAEVHPGVISLVAEDLFKAFEAEYENGYEFNVKLSYLEIYNEHAKDLLVATNEDLMIIEDAQRGVVIPSLTEFPIKTLKDILKLILQGNNRRTMASTNANQFSSRSHAIIQLIIEKRSRTKDIVDSYLQSKLCLVDLAGSERAAASENRGLRLREGANINRSLLALGNCINLLSDKNKKGSFVPYRDSKLTRLLKDSLGGNTRTVMLACVSPSHVSYEETVNTLKYASRAKNIKRKISKNTREVELHVSEYRQIIESLKNEVNTLKQKLLEKDDQEGNTKTKEAQEMALKFAAETEAALDELGKKLLAVMEEIFEVQQSKNELKELREQNEANLRLKVAELEQAVGDVEVYNKVTEELASLKEVMANNEGVYGDMEASLEALNQQKKDLETKILETISQSPYSFQNGISALGLEHSIEKIAEESVMGQQGNMTPNASKPSLAVEIQGEAVQGEQGGDRVSQLEIELMEMKRQLMQKDLQLARNQLIIKNLSNKTPNDNDFRQQVKTVSAKLSDKTSSAPKIQKATSSETAKSSSNKVHGPFVFEVDQDTSNITANNSIRLILASPTQPGTTKVAKKMSSPKTIVHSLVYNNSDNGSASTSATYTKGTEAKSAVALKGKEEAKNLRVDSSKKSPKKGGKSAQGGKSAGLSKGNTGSFKLSDKQKKSDKKNLDPILVEDLKNYAEKLNKLTQSAKNIPVDGNVDEKSSYLQQYRNRKKKQSDLNFSRQQSSITTYRLMDSPLAYNIMQSARNFTQLPLKNSMSSSNYYHNTEFQLESKTSLSNLSPTNQRGQRQENMVTAPQQGFSPDVSAIAQSVHSIEQSVDISANILENMGAEIMAEKKKEYEREIVEAPILIGKENFQRDLPELENYKLHRDGRKSPQAGFSPNRARIGERVPTESSCNLQDTDCKELVGPVQDLKSFDDLSSPNFSSYKQKAQIHDYTLASTLSRGLTPKGYPNLYTYSKQLLEDDKSMRYSISDEKFKEKKSAREQYLNERSLNAAGYGVGSGQATEQVIVNTEQSQDGREKRWTLKEAYKSTLGAGKEKSRHDIRSLDATRDLVKGFKTRLHTLASAVTETPEAPKLQIEIMRLMRDYQANSQKFPLSNADHIAMRKLEKAAVERHTLGTVVTESDVYSHDSHNFPLIPASKQATEYTEIYTENQEEPETARDENPLKEKSPSVGEQEKSLHTSQLEVNLLDASSPHVEDMRKQPEVKESHGSLGRHQGDSNEVRETMDARDMTEIEEKEAKNFEEKHSEVDEVASERSPKENIEVIEREEVKENENELEAFEVKPITKEKEEPVTEERWHTVRDEAETEEEVKLGEMSPVAEGEKEEAKPKNGKEGRKKSGEQKVSEEITNAEAH